MLICIWHLRQPALFVVVRLFRSASYPGHLCAHLHHLVSIFASGIWQSYVLPLSCPWRHPNFLHRRILLRVKQYLHTVRPFSGQQLLHTKQKLVWLDQQVRQSEGKVVPQSRNLETCQLVGIAQAVPVRNLQTNEGQTLLTCLTTPRSVFAAVRPVLQTTFLDASIRY